jgi:UDP-N-acetyl-D-glucosamine dehydrogenase
VSSQQETLPQRLEDRTATIGVAGLGDVGLPLAADFAHARFRMTEVDPHPARVAGVRAHTATCGTRHDRAKVVRL